MRRPFVRVGLLILVCAVAVVAVLTLVDLLRIKHAIDTGKARVDQLDLDAASKPGGLAAAADQAAADLGRADRIAHDSPFLGLLSHVPGASGQVAAMREITGSLADLGRVADEQAAKVQVALDASSGNPEGRLALLDAASGALDAVAQEVATMHPAAGRWLVPGLETARHDLDAKLDKARTKLADGKRSVAALRRFLAGPTRVLVLAANNAEMTVGAGMPDSSGIATVANGDIDLGQFIHSSDTYLRETGGVPTTPDLGALYANVGFGYDFRGTTSSPNWQLIGPLMRDMSAESRPLGPVDAVVLVDAFVLRDLLGAAGPVEVRGMTYSADNVMEEVLNTNYLTFADPTTDRHERTELQGDIAKAAFDAIKTRKVPLADIVKRLQDATPGRHLLAWSSDPDLDKLFHDFGADGSVTPDDLMVSLTNLGGNKIDWYLQPKLAIELKRFGDGSYLVSMTLTLANDKRDPTTPQVEGIRPDTFFLMPDVHAPGTATELTSLDKEWKATGADPPLVAANFIDDIPIGTSKSWRFSFRLPASQKTLRILPSARVHPTAITINGYPTDDAVARVIPLGALPIPGRHDVPELGGLLVALVGFGFALSALRSRGSSPVFALQREPGARLTRAEFDARAATVLLFAAGTFLALHVVWNAR